MNKKIILPIVLLCVLLFSSCSNVQENVETGFNFKFSQAIGMTEQEVYKQLNISNDSLEKSDMVGRYNLKQSVVFEDMEFSEYLLFWQSDENEDILYGGGYEYITQNDSKLSEKVSLIKTELKDIFGEPTTYPGLKNVIADKTDFSQYTLGDLQEQWKGKEDDSIVTLKLIFVEKDVRIQIEYAINEKR